MAMRMLNKIEEIEAIINRANKHLAWLEEFCQGRHKVDSVRIRPDDPQLNPGRKDLEEWFQANLPEVRIQVGEFANCFRSALNYVACALAEQDSGSVGNSVQFPIESDPDIFKSRRNTFLKGINDPHIALIQACQPYNGWKCLGLLRDLSNFYKHRGLIILPEEAHYVGWNRGYTQTQSGQIAMNVEPHLMFKITLPNGSPIVEALKVVQLRVTQMLDQFKPLINP